MPASDWWFRKNSSDHHNKPVSGRKRNNSRPGSAWRRTRRTLTRLPRGPMQLLTASSQTASNQQGPATQGCLLSPKKNIKFWDAIWHSRQRCPTFHRVPALPPTSSFSLGSAGLSSESLEFGEKLSISTFPCSPSPPPLLFSLLAFQLTF